MGGLLDTIADNYQQFSKGQKRIAEYIMHSYDDAAAEWTRQGECAARS